MNNLLKIILAIFAVVVVCSAETTPADDLSQEEIYNINADLYCQTELVIKEKLLDVVNPVNTYTQLLGDDVKDIDCEAVLKEYVIRVHKRLSADFKKKGASFKTLHCFMDKIVSLGYDQMRFKFNALYGIEIEKTKKDELRSAIDQEIGDTVEVAVDACWPKESGNSDETRNSNETESADNKKNL